MTEKLDWALTQVDNVKKNLDAGIAQEPAARASIILAQHIKNLETVLLHAVNAAAYTVHHTDRWGDSIAANHDQPICPIPMEEMMYWAEGYARLIHVESMARRVMGDKLIDVMFAQEKENEDSFKNMDEDDMDAFLKNIKVSIPQEI